MAGSVVVLIGAGGIGHAIARRIAPGRQVLVADVAEDIAARTAGALSADGHQVITHTVDVADAASVAALVKACADLGAITHLVHTAGLSPVQADIEAILRVDLLGVALVLDGFAPVMSAGGAGVVIASMAGHLAARLPQEQEKALAWTPAADLLALDFLDPATVGDPGTAYSVAKRANVLRVQAAAAAFGTAGARVNSISPGIISTSMGREELAGEHGDNMRMMIEMSAANRVGTAEDIADAAAFLLGPAASFITGTDLLVDGGAVAAVQALLSSG